MPILPQTGDPLKPAEILGFTQGVENLWRVCGEYFVECLSIHEGGRATSSRKVASEARPEGEHRMSDFPESSREGTNHPHKKGLCTPPRESKGILERRATVERLVAWRSRQRAGQSADPRLSPSLQNAVAQRVSGVQLANHGVDVVPIGFPPGTQVSRSQTIRKSLGHSHEPSVRTSLKN